MVAPVGWLSPGGPALSTSNESQPPCVERVHRVAYRICGDPDMADDLTQDVFVQLFRRLDQFRGESAFSTWVHRVALTVSLIAK